MSVDVTVAICTWNRAALLDQTLTRMRDLAVPPGAAWELLVVNNNCTDDTDGVLDRHAPHLPLRRVVEPRQGHSNARNCAVAHARGGHLIWTDDDVLVDRNWLTAYLAGFRAHPAAGFFGGRIRPWYEAPPPGWLTRHLKRFEGMLVVLDLGDRERPFGPGEAPFGANMAFRTDLLRRFRFDPTLGRVKDGNVVGDETALFRELRAAGVGGVWLPAAEVQHYVVARRLTRRYVWDYFVGLGRTGVRAAGYEYRGEPTLWGAPRWWYRVYLRARAAAAARRAAGRDWVEPYVAAATRLGMIHEARARAAGAQPVGGAA